MRECNGYSQHEAAARIDKELDSKKWAKWKTKETLLNEVGNLRGALQIAANDAWNEAYDFKENPFIKVRALRRAVRFVQYLREIEPNAGIYSNRCLAGLC